MLVGQCQAGLDQQAITVLYKPMPDEAQLRFLVFALPVELGIGIGSRSMAIVRDVSGHGSGSALQHCARRLAPAARQSRPSA